MSKMFVHYSGTVDAFKSIASQYDNKIVFIKGGADGEGAAIYTHGKYYGDVKDALASLQQAVGDLKYFTSIKAGDKTASATSKDGIITFNAADPTQVSVDVDAHGVNIGLSKTFTDAVASNTSGLAGEISRATEAEGNIRTDLGQKSDVANAEGSAFARIAKLVADIDAMTGGNGSIADQIDAAIKLLNVDAIEGDYVASISQVEGKIVPVMGTFNFDEAGAATTVKSEVIGASGDASSVNTIYGARKYAEEKASAAESAAKGYADSLVAVGSALEVRVKANEDAIDVLKGEGEGSVKKAVANGIAEVVAGAHEDFDTLKEVADWIANDTTGAASMQNAIATLNGDVTKEGSVAKQVSDAVTAEALIARAAEQANAAAIVTNRQEIEAIITENERVIAEALTNIDTRTQDLEAKKDVIDNALQASDITVGSANGTISVKGSNIAVKGLGSAAYTEAIAYATAAQGALAEAAAPQATTYTKEEVDAMWEWEEA